MFDKVVFFLYFAALLISRHFSQSVTKTSIMLKRRDELKRKSGHTRGLEMTHTVYRAGATN